MMIPYKLIDTAIEAGMTMRLYRRAEEFSIRVDKAGELMNSRAHHSEDVLAELACGHIKGQDKPHLLVGGLGMGFTLAAVLANSSADAQVTVSELIPAVVRWNREYMGEIARFQLSDARVRVVEQDVGKVMLENKGSFNAIMLDVDNGPSAFTNDENGALYSLRGLKNAYDALKPCGVLTVWSASTDQAFTRRMVEVGFEVTEQRVGSHQSKRGNRHNIWIGIRPVR